MFDAWLKSGSPIFTKRRGYTFGSVRGLINRDVIIGLADADAKEEQSESFIVHFPASAFHGGENLEVNCLGSRNQEIISGSTEKYRATINGA